MTFQPSNALSSYLPVEYILPDNWMMAKDFISKRERLTADIVNIKENGTYELNEVLSGQQWFAIQQNPRRTRYTFRKVFDLVALNGGTPIPAGLSSFPHSITQIQIPTRIFGTATSAGNFLPLPYASATGANIEIYFDNTNVNINNAYGTDLTQCYVTFEFIKG